MSNIKIKIEEYIQKCNELFWWVPEDKKKNLSNDAIVETILNYGTEEQVKELFNILSVERVAEIFKKKTNNKRSNYFPIVENYYNLYFSKYVPEYTK